MPARIPNAGLTRRDLLKRTGGLAAIAAFAAACGGNTGRPADSGGGGGSKVNLSQWYHQYGETGTKEAALKYAKAYTDSNVAVEWVPGDYGAKLASGLLSSSGPDVFESQLNIAMVKSNQVVPLDDILGDAKSDFNPNDLTTNTIDGKLYGIKMIDDPQIFYYRKSLFEKAGIKPPETVDDLIAAAKELTTDKVKGLFLGNFTGAGGVNISVAGPALWSSGGAYLTADNKPGFTGERAALAFSKLRELNQSNSLLLGAPADWADPGAFTQGLAAMQWCGLWAMPGIQKALGDDFGVFAQDLEQFPSPLQHVGPPADELLPLLGGGAKDPEVGDVLPMGRIGRGFGGTGRLCGHRGGSGETISRVLFTRWYEQMVISLGWLSPATSCGLPAAQTTRAGSRCLFGLAPTGGCRATSVAGRAVGSYPTVSPLPFGYKGRSVLCGPVPSPLGAQALPGGLPCGARTFLEWPLLPATRDHRPHHFQRRKLPAGRVMGQAVTS